MQRLIILLGITLLVAIFAFQNSLVVNLQFWFWKADLHIGLVLIITFIIGAMIGIISSFPLIVRKNKKIRDLISQQGVPLEIIDQETEVLDTDTINTNSDSDKRDKGQEPPDPEFEDVIQ